MTRHLPPFVVLRALILRVTLLWFTAHVILFSIRQALIPVSSAALLVVGIVLIVRYQMQRGNELVLLANLGIPFRMLVPHIVILCALYEGVLRSLLG